MNEFRVFEWVDTSFSDDMLNLPHHRTGDLWSCSWTLTLRLEWGAKPSRIVKGF